MKAKSTQRVTDDGILRSEWDMIHNFALEIANAALQDNIQEMASAKQKLLERIAVLRKKYGDLPTLLATEADYTDAHSQRRYLLESAYRSAKRMNDARNMTYIAHSLAAFHTDVKRNDSRARLWLSRLRKCLDVYSESYEKDEYTRLSSVMKKRGFEGSALKRTNKP